jgi:hypothetical protein
MNNSVIPAIDGNFVSVREATGSHAHDDSSAGGSNVVAIVVGVLVPVALLSLISAVCYARRRDLSEWMLWKVCPSACVVIFLQEISHTYMLKFALL